MTNHNQKCCDDIDVHMYIKRKKKIKTDQIGAKNFIIRSQKRKKKHNET